VLEVRVVATGLFLISPQPLDSSASLGKGAVLPPNYTQTDTTGEMTRNFYI